MQPQGLCKTVHVKHRSSNQILSGRCSLQPWPNPVPCLMWSSLLSNVHVLVLSRSSAFVIMMAPEGWSLSLSCLGSWGHIWMAPHWRHLLGSWMLCSVCKWQTASSLVWACAPWKRKSSHIEKGLELVTHHSYPSQTDPCHPLSHPGPGVVLAAVPLVTFIEIII